MTSARKIAKSELEETFLSQIAMLGLPMPETQYRFHPTRRWEFDGAYPDYKLAFEVEGAIYVNGRHTRGSGFIKDAEKYNEAARLGWMLLRFPSPWIASGDAVNYLEMVLKQIGATE